MAFRVFLHTLLILIAFGIGSTPSHANNIQPAAYNISAYINTLQNKKVALVINQTSEINGTLLLDTLLALKINVVKVFVPEHGFRGLADAGASVKSGVDEKTNTPIISLYGKNKKPARDQLQDVDIIVYDLQDVGVRFYTYISTLQYMMEAAALYNKSLLVLDRPNPNGHYVDGPVLQEEQKSFVGLQPVPVVYGMTSGEYAQMLKGEKWMSNADKLNLEVLTCKNYDHTKMYQLPVAPSPNLKNMAAIYLYPSLCFFEGTVISLGRGTDKPFQQWGHPGFAGKSPYAFTPVSMIGATDPVLKNQECYGQLLAIEPSDAIALMDKQLKLDWLIKAYSWYDDKNNFFNNFFDNLAGNKTLKQQIQSGMIAQQIRDSWKADVDKFKKIRKKYLLYKDFE